MHRLRTVTSLDVSAVAGHNAMPAALLFPFTIFCIEIPEANGKDTDQTPRLSIITKISSE